MATVNVYLNFDGNCEEAFTFYKDVFQTKLCDLQRFKDMPEMPGMEVKEEDKDKLMHVSLKISKETVLMGSDTVGEWSPGFKAGNNFSIYINTDSKEEADRFYNELLVDGQVIMPLEKTFWGSYFGMLSDKFGINWMVGFDTEEE